MPKKKFNDQPFPYHHELEVEIATLTNLGVGLGRVQVGEGKPDGHRPGDGWCFRASDPPRMNDGQRTVNFLS